MDLLSCDCKLIYDFLLIFWGHTWHRHSCPGTGQWCWCWSRPPWGRRRQGARRRSRSAWCRNTRGWAEGWGTPRRPRGWSRWGTRRTTPTHPLCPGPSWVEIHRWRLMLWYHHGFILVRPKVKCLFIPDEEKRNRTTRFVLELMFAKEAKTRLKTQKECHLLD